MNDATTSIPETDDPFLQNHRLSLLQSTLPYQRRIFIETLRKGQSFQAAMKNAGIEDRFVALEVYKRNSRVVTKRVLVNAEQVR